VVVPEDLLVPQYSINGKQNGSLAVSKGQQWLHHFALAAKGSTTSVGSMSHFKWLQLVECWTTKDKLWLLYRIEGSIYADRKK
jgi:hypothetical protein